MAASSEKTDNSSLAFPSARMEQAILHFCEDVMKGENDRTGTSSGTSSPGGSGGVISKMSKAKSHCLYCGEPTKRGRRGEHIVPEAIGGALTLNDVSSVAVCPKCNSGVLSQLDRELCSRSYLSVIASRELGAHLWQTWDVDHESNNLLVEARPNWAADESLNSLVCYPQITFERSGQAVRGDSEEFRQFGQEAATRVLIQAVRHCFGRYRDGEKGALNFERVRSGVIHDGYRLAPRIFTPHPIDEVARHIREQSFVLRFASEEDKYFALQSLPNLTDGWQLKKWTRKLGSHYPTICFFFDIGDTMRALMKLGLNLVAAHCPNSPVNYESFATAIRIIRGEAGRVLPRIMMANGFVRAQDLQDIKATGNAHSFRLIHDRTWHVFSSFFGGQVGAYVRVPGPNHEEWRCADIVAPLGSKDWTVRTSLILPYMKKVAVSWDDRRGILPTFKLQNSMLSVSVEFVKKRLPRN